MEKPRRARPIRDLEQIIRELPGYDPFDQAGDCTFDVVAARSAIHFIETQLSHVRGALARKPFLLERWQQAIVANLFGWCREDGTRRYRECFLLCPRKNGKSMLAAAIIAYCLFEDGENAAEVLGVASTFQQASLIFSLVHGMVVQNDSLSDRCTVYRGTGKAIQLDDGFSVYRVCSAEAAGLHGVSASCYVVDEVHALPDGELTPTLHKSGAAAG